MVFQILGGFSLKLSFPRKQTRQHNPLSKNCRSIVRLFSKYKKINNFVIFDSKTWNCLGNGCPVNYQKVFEKHVSSINIALFSPPAKFRSPLDTEAPDRPLIYLVGRTFSYFGPLYQYLKQFNLLPPNT